MANLFATVPQKDHLHLIKSEADRIVPDPAAIGSFLEMSRKDFASIAGLAPGSVRYEADRINSSLAELLIQIASICNLVADYFDGDATKTAQWFRLPNPMLGNVSPRNMIRAGRYKKLLKFVQTQLEASKATMDEARSKASGDEVHERKE